MNKFGMVLGVAAVATLSGCKDPDFKYHTNHIEEVKAAEPVEVCPEAQPVEVTADVAPASAPASELAPIPAPAPVVAPKDETTTYIIQRGDSLSKISKRYNIKLAALRAANPKLKNDVVRIGQKIQLPGKVEVGEQKIPEGAFAKPVRKEYKPYAGATREYVVKNGDSLGKIAYSNGINIRQLKELNALSGDVIRIGQKLKIPAGADKAVVAKPVEKPVAKPAPVKPAEKKPAEPVVRPVEKPAEPAPVAEPAPAAAPVAEPAEVPAVEAAAADTGFTYIVQEGDDMTGVSIRWGVSAAAIRELNNLGENDQLVPGQVLKLPADAQQ